MRNIKLISTSTNCQIRPDHLGSIQTMKLLQQSMPHLLARQEMDRCNYSNNKVNKVKIEAISINSLSMLNNINSLSNTTNNSNNLNISSNKDTNSNR